MSGEFFLGFPTAWSTFEARFDLEGVVRGSPKDIPMGTRWVYDTVSKDEAGRSPEPESLRHIWYSEEDQTKQAQVVQCVRQE